MSDLSTIRAFQRTLSTFSFTKADSFSETFAQQRFLKKFQVPDESEVNQLSEICFSNWLANDESLPQIVLPHTVWYKTRSHLHSFVGVPKLRDIGFPKGSEYSPTRGKNSLEAKLASSKWDCTPSVFLQFCKLAYHHKGLKRAFRRRYFRWYRRRSFDISKKASDNFLFKKFSNSKDIGYSVFCWKMAQVVTFVQGSRFATVPKNNEKRRPINVEPFCNLVVQRTLGNWIRSELFKIFNIDLDNLASIQRVRIKNTDTLATIDLKDASDSISLDLCRFLLPRRLFSIIERSRSPMVLGLDGAFHVAKKVSSMGNGFTFELMTLILTSVARQFDCNATVFGDDIIISSDQAPHLIKVLESVGLKVNLDKSFISGPFRESCGANFHEDEGYIESYDFLWPSSIGDCVVIFNKCYRLSLIYDSFKILYDQLLRSLPVALHGGPDWSFKNCNLHLLIDRWDRDDTSSLNFPLFFVTPKRPRRRQRVRPTLRSYLSSICLDSNDFYLVKGFEFKPHLRSPTFKHLRCNAHWAKYEMYLNSGRRCNDVVTGRGDWVPVWFLNSGQRNFRVSGFVLI